MALGGVARLAAVESHRVDDVDDDEHGDKNNDCCDSRYDNKGCNLRDYHYFHCPYCSEPKTYVFDPCGHVCCCKDCAEQLMTTLKKCPMCREVVTKHLRVYM